MNKVVHRKRKKRVPVMPEFTRRRVLVCRGGALRLMDKHERFLERCKDSPTVGQVEYLRKKAHAADHHMVRAQDLIDVIALAVTNPEFGKARGAGKGPIGGDTIAGQLAVVIDEIEAIRHVLFTKEVLSHVSD